MGGQHTLLFTDRGATQPDDMGVMGYPIADGIGDGGVGQFLVPVLCGDLGRDRHLALAALDMALGQRCPGRGLVHHTDRGSTYASKAYRKALRSRGIRCSMSRKGDCWDNAVAESFFATLKREIEDIDSLESLAGANLSIGEYIDGFYNPQRRHSAINYNSPIKFELMHSMKKAA